MCAPEISAEVGLVGEQDELTATDSLAGDECSQRDAAGCFRPFPLEEPMTFNAAANGYELVFMTAVDLRGRRISIQTDEGGSYNAFVE